MPRKIDHLDREEITTVDEFIRYAVAKSGKSGTDISREIGRSDNFIWSLLRNGSMPRLDTFVSIANACGYEFLLQGDGGETWRMEIGPDGDIAMSHFETVRLEYFPDIEDRLISSLIERLSSTIGQKESDETATGE